MLQEMKEGQKVEMLPVSDLKLEAGQASQPAGKASDRAVISLVVEAWFDEHVRNSPISRATEAHNHLLKHLPDLKSRLAEALKE